MRNSRQPLRCRGWGIRTEHSRTLNQGTRVPGAEVINGDATRVNRGIGSVDVGDSSTRFPGRSGRRSRGVRIPGMSRGRLVKGAMAALAIAAFVATASAQGFRRGNRFFEPLRSPTPESFDGSFNFCRIMFPHDPSFYGDGGGWSVDYPRADINLSIRLSELTKTRISRQPDGEPNHLVMDLNNPAMFNCPFIMMTEVGARVHRTRPKRRTCASTCSRAGFYGPTTSGALTPGRTGPASSRRSCRLASTRSAISRAIIRSSTRSSRLRACRRFPRSASGAGLAARRPSADHDSAEAARARHLRLTRPPDGPHHAQHRFRRRVRTRR